MTRALFTVVVFFAVIGLSFEATAQSDTALAARKARLTALIEQLRQRDASDRVSVQQFANRLGIPRRRELPNGTVLELRRIAPDIGPVFYITNNVDAADTVSTDEVWPGGSAALVLDGADMTIGEWDGGAVFAEHSDLTGRVTQVDLATLQSDHATHVAGTLVGAGESVFYPDARGMAYAAHLDAYDWNDDTTEMAGAASVAPEDSGLLVSNHSYGIAAGWLYTGDPDPPHTWLWIGGADPSYVEDWNFGYYDSESQLWDQIAVEAPYYLIVKSAGNDRTDIGPPPDEEYTIIDQAGDPVSTSTVKRNPDCWPAGYDCLPTTSVAKNILTVGAVDDIIGGYSPYAGPSSVQMAEFSGWGPTDDGRIKPDLVGNGVFLVSTFPDPYSYAAASGTSMSAPNVAGSLILLQQHYQDIHGADNFMRAATLKALAIHTADEAGSAAGPDYAFGWGLLNTKAAAQLITDAVDPEVEVAARPQIMESALADQAVNFVDISPTGTDSIITATLVWADPPGDPATPSLDPTDLMLVNDLDLRILRGPTEYFPWVLNPAAPTAAATTGDNIRDNVEQVVIDGAVAGTYRIEVRNKGSLLNGQDQDYSLIISVQPRPQYVTDLLIDEDFSGGLSAGWSVATNSGVDWTINTPVPNNPRLDNLTGGAGEFAVVDNSLYQMTVTSLETPAFDLSHAEGVILRFKSFYIYDFIESLNVDVSVDGGANWMEEVWRFQGFNPLPTNYIVDLTEFGAGEASFKLRFRFDSEGELSGNLWQVDDVQLEAFSSASPLPGKALNPSPAHGGSGAGLDSDLSWSAGALATSHAVYFGTDGTLGPSDHQGTQPGTSFNPGALAPLSTYYWRIDEINANGSRPGNTWSFTTGPMAYVPVPTAFVPTSPCRLVDTRRAGGTFTNRETRYFLVRGADGVLTAAQGGANQCNISPDAVAVQVTLSAVSPTGVGYLRAWNWGIFEPNATLLQYTAAGGISNSAVVPNCSPDESCTYHVSVKTYGAPTHLVIDISGYYVPHP